MSQKVKYPRTFHLPWSEGTTSDDKKIDNTIHFAHKLVVVTEKMDGENANLYCDGYHARSLDAKNHPSRNWLKTFHASVAFNIPRGMRVCGENLYAKHSIHYTNLPSYFLAFSVWEGDYCLNWNDTKHYCEMLGIMMVPVLYEGIYNEKIIKGLYKEGTEGYVVRLANSFEYKDFGISVAKFVRKGHVQIDEHWMHQEIVPNLLINKGE